MVYPQSPFTNKFDIATCTSLNKADDSVGNNKEINLEKLLQWLCLAPKLSSYRINTNKYTRKYARELLINEIIKLSPNENICEQILFHPILSDVIIVKCLENDSELERREKEVIVDSFCGTAILRGSHLYAPGVLSMESGTQKGDIVSIYVDISKQCKKGLKIKFESPLKIFIGNGEVKMVRKELFGENLVPSGIAVKMRETISKIPSLDDSSFPKDCMLLQNLPSILCGHILDPKPNELILDMCASPGNKTTHLGLLIKNQGTIIAIDKTKNKVDQLQKNCDKYNLNCIHTFVNDSTKIYDKGIGFTKKENIILGPPFNGEIFDKILLDAPCSNLGKRPQLYNNITTKEVRSYVPIQRKLFANAVNLLKPKGHLVYSTCTITLAENEGMVSWALNTFDSLSLIASEPTLGSPGWPGTNLTEKQRKLLQRFGPDDNTDSVGFFIAHFIKK